MLGLNIIVFNRIEFSGDGNHLKHVKCFNTVSDEIGIQEM